MKNQSESNQSNASPERSANGKLVYDNNHLTVKRTAGPGEQIDLFMKLGIMTKQIRQNLIGNDSYSAIKKLESVPKTQVDRISGYKLVPRSRMAVYSNRDYELKEIDDWYYLSRSIWYFRERKFYPGPVLITANGNLRFKIRIDSQKYQVVEAVLINQPTDVKKMAEVKDAICCLTFSNLEVASTVIKQLGALMVGSNDDVYYVANNGRQVIGAYIDNYAVTTDENHAVNSRLLSPINISEAGQVQDADEVSRMMQGYIHSQEISNNVRKSLRHLQD
ncbi:hypothetical protein [Levilactobacillus tujiorum]|uniref:hypothetical protein n=1 Tax=Levilactobacillus tujiorum TaxID=2912243 RepID=UPI0014571651|nr:hypothetical protein [Levilactobacillus tujiorum]NLR32796.1 hypothetical protein [Levilactobacillus tujiorum]